MAGGFPHLNTQPSGTRCLAKDLKWNNSKDKGEELSSSFTGVHLSLTCFIMHLSWWKFPAMDTQHLLWVTWTKICPQDKLSYNQKQTKRNQCIHSLIIGRVVFTPFHQRGEGSCAAQVNASRLSFLWTVILFVPSNNFSLPMTSVRGSLTVLLSCIILSETLHCPQ